MWDDLDKLKIESIRKNNDLVNRVIDGSTSLEKEVRGIEERFYKAAFRVVPKKEEIKQCGNNLIEIEKILDCIRPYCGRIPNQGDYYKYFNGESYIKGGAATSILGVAGGIVSSIVFPPLIPVAMVLILSGLAASGVFALMDNSYQYKDKKKWKRAVHSTFSSLEKEARRADHEIREAYMTDYYRRCAQEPLTMYETRTATLFKKTFTGMAEERQRLLIKELLSQEVVCQHLDDWISWNYSELVDEEGRNNYLIGRHVKNG